MNIYQKIVTKIIGTKLGWTYLLKDDFSSDLAAGAVDGTLATDGVNVRTVNDAQSKISISGGNLSFSGGNSTLSITPAIVYPALTAAAGLVLVWKINIASGRADTIGWSVATSVQNPQSAGTNGVFMRFIVGSIYATNNGNVHRIVGTYTTGTEYTVYIAQRSSGAQYFISGGAFVYPTLLFVIDSSGGVSMYPQLRNYDGVLSSEAVRVANGFLAVPLVSDGFSVNGTSDGLGHAETSGIGSGGSGVSWSNVGGGWSVSGGKAINTPSLGSELIANGNMETGSPPSNWSALNASISAGTGRSGTGQSLVTTNSTPGSFGHTYQVISIANGKWAMLSAWGRRITTEAQVRVWLSGFGGLLYSIPAYTSPSWTSQFITFRAGATTQIAHTNFATGSGLQSEIDDVSLVELTLSSLLSLHPSSTPDVFAGIDITVVAGTQVGLALNWDSSSNPQNGVIAYHDGTNCKLEKCVAGVWTTVVSAAATYSANARIVVSKIGTAYRLYYNNALVGSGTISDAGIINNTLHGLFSTNSSNTLDNYTCYASGSNGEYSILNSI